MLLKRKIIQFAKYILAQMSLYLSNVCISKINEIIIEKVHRWIRFLALYNYTDFRFTEAGNNV